YFSEPACLSQYTPKQIQKRRPWTGPMARKNSRAVLDGQPMAAASHHCAMAKTARDTLEKMVFRQSWLRFRPYSQPRLVVSRRVVEFFDEYRFRLAGDSGSAAAAPSPELQVRLRHQKVRLFCLGGTRRAKP